jgi:hypothetical protein
MILKCIQTNAQYGITTGNIYETIYPHKIITRNGINRYLIVSDTGDEAEYFADCFEIVEFEKHPQDKQDKGLKFDTEKLRMDLIPVEVINALAQVLTYGAKKYAPNSWQNVEPFNDRYYAALLRHLMLWRSGEIIDKESGLPHLTHALANVAFLLTHELKEGVK